MPDILPVSLQDFLHRRKSELRKYKIRENCHMRRGADSSYRKVFPCRGSGWGHLLMSSETRGVSSSRKE